MASIVSYCAIKQGKIWKDGRVFLEPPGLSLPDFLNNAYQLLALNYPKYYKMDSLSKLGVLASEVLLLGASANVPEPTAVVLSNSNSSLDSDLKYWASAQKAASPSLFVYTLPNIVGGEICIRHGFKGETNFFVSPQFDPEWLVSNVELTLLKNSNSCLAGWVDVLGDHAEVFLYLTVKSGVGMYPQTAETLTDLFTHGATDIKS